MEPMPALTEDKPFIEYEINERINQLLSGGKLRIM